MYKLYIAILFFFIQTISAQQLRQPFDFPILLSGNFGELRNNHFHSGIDFKTQGVEGKPIHAVQDGYVSRISVSPWGRKRFIPDTSGRNDNRLRSFATIRPFHRPIYQDTAIRTGKLQRELVPRPGPTPGQKRRNCRL